MAWNATWPRLWADVEPAVEADPGLVEWAAAALLDGRELSDVLAEAFDTGWDAGTAEASVEAARVATRAERGVITRADVIGGLGRRSDSTVGTMFRGLGLMGFAGALRSALKTSRHLRSVARRGSG